MQFYMSGALVTINLCRCNADHYQRQLQKPFYSMTSSARAITVGGTARPSVLAVFAIQHQFEFGGLLDREFAGLRALEILST